MAKKLFIIGFVVVLVFGAGCLGYFFAEKQALPPTADAHDLDKFIDSELAKSFSALVSGEVVSASGTALIIQNKGSRLSFEIPKDAIFYKQPAERLASAEEIKLADLKPHEAVNIFISFGKGGRIGSLNGMLLRKSSLPTLPE